MALGAPLPPPPSLAAVMRGTAAPSLFLDFDGTLVELAQAPDAIAVPPTLVGQLEELVRVLDGRLALVSGRSPQDLRRYLGSMAVALAGSHGAAITLADGTTLGPAAQGLPHGALEELRTAATQLDIRYEAKSHGGALHWRENPDAEGEAIGTAQRVARAHGLALKMGKAVVELVRPGADKGAAVRQLMATYPFAGSRPIFVGDDVTDEDGMAMATAMGGFGIAVGERDSAAAQFRLSDVAAVHKWLFR